MIPIAEWTPDLPDFQNPGATEAKNVIPHGESYKPLNDLSAYSDALDARPQGAISVRDSDANVFLFAGTASKIQKLDGTNFNDVSISGGYTTNADEIWEFTQFGDRIIATNFNDAMQSFVMGSSALFANLSATAPQARHIAVVRDFPVVGNTFDGTDGNKPERVRWPSITDETAWTVSATTQADFQDLKGRGGWVQRIIGGEYGTIFQEHSITRMTYVGSPNIFQFDEMEKNRGALTGGGVVSNGAATFYIAEDGFYVFDGRNSIPIGENKVDKTFIADLDGDYLQRVTSTVDQLNKVIIWSYPGSGNTAGQPNKLIIFNYSPSAKKRWSQAEIDTEVLIRGSTGGYTLEGLDAVNTSIDALPFSLDSRAWTGGSLQLATFDGSDKLATFTGSALTATLETQEFEPHPSQRTMLTSLRPIVEGGNTVSVQIGTRERQSNSVVWGSSSTMKTDGRVDLRENAPYMRARLNLTGGFTHVQGIDDLVLRPAGRH